MPNNKEKLQQLYDDIDDLFNQHNPHCLIKSVRIEPKGNSKPNPNEVSFDLPADFKNKDCFLTFKVEYRENIED